MKFSTQAYIAHCPFCGAEAEIEGVMQADGPMKFRVQCSDFRCVASECVMLSKTLDDAIAKWNRRVEKGEGK